MKRRFGLPSLLALVCLATHVAQPPTCVAGDGSEPGNNPPSQALVAPQNTGLGDPPNEPALRGAVEERLGKLSDSRYAQFKRELIGAINNRYGVSLTDDQFGALDPSLIQKLLDPHLDIDDSEGIMFLVGIKDPSESHGTFWSYNFARHDLKNAGFKVHSTQFVPDKDKVEARIKEGTGLALALGSARDIVRTIAALRTGTANDLGRSFRLFFNAKKIPFEKEPGSLAELLWQERWNIAGDLGRKCVWSVLRAARLDVLVRAVRESGLKLPRPRWKPQAPPLPEAPSNPPLLPPADPSSRSE